MMHRDDSFRNLGFALAALAFVTVQGLALEYQPVVNALAH